MSTKEKNANILRDLVYGVKVSPLDSPASPNLESIFRGLVADPPSTNSGTKSIFDSLLPKPGVVPLSTLGKVLNSGLRREENESWPGIVPGALVPLAALGDAPHLGTFLPEIRKESPEVSPLGIKQCQMLMGQVSRRPVTVNSGRVLPSIDDLAILEGRNIRAAFLYSDLHGFSKIIATKTTRLSLQLLQAFVEFSARVTSHYGGSVVDCAGDRVLSVFHRPETDFSEAPIRSAITAALWMQTILQRVIAPKFIEMGLVDKVGAAMGIDYGPVTAGCVGIRNNKHFLFCGDASNNASKLQEMGDADEIVISSSAYLGKPSFLNHPSWTPVFEYGRIRLRQRFVDSVLNPPKVL